jgi:hypothetical protein
MAFGSSSAIFTQAMKNPLLRSIDPTNITLPTGYTDLTTDTVNCALFGNGGTPNKTDTLANTGYNTGQWTTGNEVSGTGYTAAGQALTSITYGIDATLTSALAYHAANPSWTGASFTAYGDLVYDNSISGGTVAKQGICFHSYGGSAQTIGGGTFTIAWYSTGYSSGVVFAITT